MHAQFAERGTSPAEFFTRLPNHHPASATSSRGSLDRERTNSPQLSLTTSPAHAHPPVAYKVLAPYKSSRASISPDPTNSNSSVSLTLIPEGNIIRRKLSIILTRQREPTQQQATKNNNRPQSISSIGSSCANSPQSQASQSPQSNSLRSLQAVVAATGNTTTNSSNASLLRAAMTTSSFVDAGAAVVALDAADPTASCVTVPDTAAPVPKIASRDKETTRMMTMSRRSRGESSTGNCTLWETRKHFAAVGRLLFGTSSHQFLSRRLTPNFFVSCTVWISAGLRFM